MISWTHASLTGLAALVCYVVYQRLLHPLAKYPGPFWASMTDVWSLKLSTQGNWPQRLQQLHAQYGPVVRIAPNEVAIDKPEAIGAICEPRYVGLDIFCLCRITDYFSSCVLPDGLNQGNQKTKFYIPFGNPAQKPNLFNAIDDQYHGQLRRWSGNICELMLVLPRRLNAYLA